MLESFKYFLVLMNINPEHLKIGNSHIKIHISSLVWKRGSSGRSLPPRTGRSLDRTPACSLHQSPPGPPAWPQRHVLSLVWSLSDPSAFAGPSPWEAHPPPLKAPLLGNLLALIPRGGPPSPSLPPQPPGGSGACPALSESLLAGTTGLCGCALATGLLLSG